MPEQVLTSENIVRYLYIEDLLYRIAPNFRGQIFS